jgi:hypothetical protein
MSEPPAVIEPRHVELPDGRTVVVRAGTRDDLDGLASLYAGLSDEDTYLRFFSAHRPGAELFEQMVTLADRGGALLVVEAEEGTGDHRAGTIVGDAWYAMLPNGDGELAITVAKQWRGWLGGFLLDALLDVAADNGIPNLEAEIMLRNRPMMALVRHRGCVRMADDGAAARVAVATRGRVPSWPREPDRPRLLVEGRRSWHAHDAASRRGLSVLVCPGPASVAGQCPALSGGVCPLADEADAILVAVAPDDSEARELIRRHRDRHPGMPLFAEGRPREPLDDGVSLVDPLAGDEDVTDLVMRALAAADERVLTGGPPPEAPSP